MLLLDEVMVFRRNVPRWARVFDEGLMKKIHDLILAPLHSSTIMLHKMNFQI